MCGDNSPCRAVAMACSPLYDKMVVGSSNGRCGKQTSSRCLSTGTVLCLCWCWFVDVSSLLQQRANNSLSVNVEVNVEEGMLRG